MLWYPLILKATIRASLFRNNLLKLGKQTGVITYHTHTYDSWSPDDLEFNKRPFSDVPHIRLLYRADIDNFEAIDEKNEPITIKVINNR